MGGLRRTVRAAPRLYRSIAVSEGFWHPGIQRLAFRIQQQPDSDGIGQVVPDCRTGGVSVYQIAILNVLDAEC
jgi:hypothetical protein